MARRHVDLSSLLPRTRPDATFRAALGTALGVRLLRSVLLFLALALLRLEHAHDLQLTLAAARGHALATGLANDFLVAVLVECASELAALPSESLRTAAWTPLGLFAFGATFADTLYFKAFGNRLDLWIVRGQYDDFGVGGDPAQALGATPRLAAAVLAMLVALVVAQRSARGRTPGPWGKGLGAAGIGVAACVLLFVAGAGAKVAVVRKADANPRSHVLAGQVLVNWAKELEGRQNEVFHVGSASELGDLDGVLRDLRAHGIGAPDRVLASYRDLDRPAAKADPRWPLLTPLPEQSRAGRELRQAMGLAGVSRPNVVVLFVDGLGADEFFHPRRFPRLRALLDRQGLVFPQAYGSSAEAGQSSRAQFTTLCSMLPNMGAPAPAIAFPEVRVRCLPDVLRASGYQTSWITQDPGTFQNAGDFASLHGVERFVDSTRLPEAAKMLSGLAAEHRPLFASILTDAHEDEAIARFLEQLFASPMGEDTVVALLGTHGAATEGTPLQRAEAPYRVPLAFVSRRMRAPGVVRHFVHQLDVAPMIADLLGLQGNATWLGRAAFERPGSAFVHEAGGALHYRTRDQVCHTLAPGAAPICWAASPTDDPLVAPLSEAKENSGQTAFFGQVAMANRQAIVLNLVAPPEGRGVVANAAQ